MAKVLENIARSNSTNPLDELKKSIVTYDNELAISAAKKIVKQGIDLIEALDAMTTAIRSIGNAFGRGDLWLCDLVAASEAMSSAVPIIEEEINRRGLKRESLGIVVIGTVLGDIHTIGKTMVATLLAADGFEIHDIGVDVKAEEFLEAIKKDDTDVLCMSALMTTTAPEQRKVIELLKKQGIRDKVKIMVGGAAVTEEFAKDIGADGYAPTAPEAVKLARKLVGR